MVSYVRRIAQARFDLVAGEIRRRSIGTGPADSGELSKVLGHHLSGGPARPPRPTEDSSGHPLAAAMNPK